MNVVWYDALSLIHFEYLSQHQQPLVFCRDRRAHSENNNSNLWTTTRAW